MDVSLRRLSRLPRRVRDDAKIVRLARNWRELLKAKRDQSPVARIELRNGVVLESPPEMNLNFLFHEIWIEETYAPSGYEIRDGDLVVDVGGNIGVFSTYAATRAGNVSVHAFEPYPTNAAFFSSNVAKSGLKNVVLETVAVAASTESRRLHVATSFGCHSLLEDPGRDAVGEIDVACTTLERIVSRTTRCDVLKLDCEGGEHEILRSASSDTLGRVHRIVLEYHNGEQGTGQTVKEVLEHHGFRVDVFRAFDPTVGLLCATNRNYRRH